LPDSIQHLVPPDPVSGIQHPHSVTQIARSDQPASQGSGAREIAAWTALGGLVGLLVLLVVYRARAEGELWSWLVGLHRQWPAFFVLDALPFVLAWVGWLTGQLRVAHRTIHALEEQTGPLAGPALAQTLLEAVLVTDAEGRVVAANPAARRFFGRDPVGRAIRELLVDFERADRVERLAQSGQLLGMEWLFTAKAAGRTVPVRVSCGPMPDRRVLYVLTADNRSHAPDPKLASLLREQDRERARALLLQSLASRVLSSLEDGELKELTGDVLSWLRSEGEAEDCSLGAIFDAVRARVQQEEGVNLGFRGETLVVSASAPKLIRILTLLVLEACRGGGGSLQVIARLDPDDPRTVRIDVADRTLLPSEPGSSHDPAMASRASFSLWVPLAAPQRTLIPTNLPSDEDAPTDPGI
jgi:PAS domain S-box-containing protein